MTSGSRLLPSLRALAVRLSTLLSTGTRLRWTLGAAALLAIAAIVGANPYPPYWGGGTGPAVHFAPVAWPAAGDWTAYTHAGVATADPAVNDPSNGGTSPQGYVNVSSGCTDQSAPSTYFAFRDGVLFFRWRVKQAPNNYATGPSPGNYSATSPWSSALWTVLVDVNGDGFRDFALQLDGSSGSPSAAVDRITAVYSTTRSQSVDYVNDPAIHLLGHNPTAFVDQASSRILNFQGTLTPTTSWPNGAAETQWDYGTTRTTLINTGCGEYFIDYQLPLAMLDASGLGGPTVTSSTPMSLFFSTSNSLNNPMQKDAVLAGDYIADPTAAVPFGDTITPAGGVVPQPIVQAVTAQSCGPVQLTATIADTLTAAGATTVTAAEFYAYLDIDGDGTADDGSTWTKIADGTSSATMAGRWSGSWASQTQSTGQYLIGVKATDAQGNITWSYLTSAQVTSQKGSSPPHYANPSDTGTIWTPFVNTCGTSGASMSVAVDNSQVGPGDPVVFTITITNPSGSPLPITSISDVLPPGFTYQSTGAGTLTPTGTPTVGDTGTVTWTFTSTSVPASGTGTLIFTANATTVAGGYSSAASAVTGGGSLSADPVAINVGTAALTLLHTVSPATAAPGNTLVYSITYANNSGGATSGTVLEEELPAGVTFVSATGGGSYSGFTNSVTWAPGAVLAGAAPTTVTVTVTVDSPFPGTAGPIDATATLTSDQTAPQAVVASTYVDAAKPSFTIQLDANQAQIAPNGSVTFTVSYANVGSGPATGTQVQLPVPTGFSFTSATGGGTFGSGTVTWNVGNVAEGASGSLQVTLQASNSYNGASPAAFTSTLTSAETTPVADTYELLVTISGNVCRIYYFRNATTDVGFDATQRVANTTAVTGQTGNAVQVTAPANGNPVLEAVRFYQDPGNKSDTQFSGSVTTTIFIDRASGPGITLHGTLYDYNPVGGAKEQLGTNSQSFLGSKVGEFSFSVPTSGTLDAGHRLLWVFSVVSNNTQTPDLRFQFSGTVANTLGSGSVFAESKADFCTTAPATPTLEAQASAATVQPNDTVTYTMRFGNAGASVMGSSALELTLPAGLSFVSATLDGANVSPTSSVGQVHSFSVHSTDTATAGQITNGQQGSLSVVAQVSRPFTGTGPTLTATATLSSGQTSAISDTAAVTLLTPRVSIMKSASETVADPGDTVTYTLTVLNSGTGTATNVSVVDVLPATAYYTYVAGSATKGGTTVNPDPVASDTLTVPIASLAAGASTVITYQMHVEVAGAPAGLTPATNTATVSDAQTSGTRSSNGVQVTIRTTPALTLAVTPTPAGPVAPGDTIAYSIVVTNAGASNASNVVVTSNLPANTSYVVGSISGIGASVDLAGQHVSFSLGTLAAGASTTLTYSVKVNASLPHGDTAIAQAATATSSNAATQTASTNVQATAAAQMTLTKTGPQTVRFPLTTLAANASGTTVTVASTDGLGVGQVIVINGTAAKVVGVSGSQVTLDTSVTGSTSDPVRATVEYVITYANAGNAPATGVAIADQFPTAVFISASGGVTPVADTVSWNIGTVAPGESGSVRLRLMPYLPGGMSNTATETDFLTIGATSNTVVTGVGSLILSKVTTTPTGVVSDGETTVTYVITLTNQHPSVSADDVTVRDEMPPGFVYLNTTSVTGSPTPYSHEQSTSAEAVWDGITVPAGGQVTITFVALARNVGAGTFDNSVTASSDSLFVTPFDGLTTTAENVTFAAARGTTAYIGAPASAPAGATLGLTLSDIDLDTDPLAVQQVVVSVRNTRTNEIESVTVTETGPATGIFTGSMVTAALGTAGTNGDGTMNARADDTLQASYVDPLGATGGSVTVTADTGVTQVGSPTTPTVTSVSVPANGTYKAGSVFDFTVTFSEAVTIDTSGGTPRIAITLDTGGTVYATYVSGSGTTTLVFRMVVQQGQMDLTGITVGSLQANGGTVKSVAANVDADLTLNNVASTANVFVDTDPPTLSISAPSVSSTTQGPVSYTITYSGASSVSLTTGNISVNATGTAAAGNVAVTGSGSTTRTVTLSSITGVGTLGISIAASTASDVAGNLAAAAGPSATFDVVAPPVSRTLTSLSPSSGKADGGVTVVLVGQGFSTLVHPVVHFGTAEALSVVVIDDHTIIVVTPPRPAGVALDVSLADDAGAVGTLAQSYTPLAPPPTQIIDTDDDGMPDSWELLHGLDPLDPGDAAEDPDGDGVSNSDEFANDTHPTATFVRYFAEGATLAPMATVYSFFNPDVANSSVVLRFYTESGATSTHAFDVPGRTRVELDAATFSGLGNAVFGTRIESSATLAIENTVAWDATRYGAHSSRAVPASPTWYFAEGATHAPLDLFYLLLNPTDAAIVVQARHYLQSTGTPVTQSLTVPAHSRMTLWVDQVPGLESAELSTQFHSVGDVPFVVERAVYSADGGVWSAGHRSAGAMQPRQAWSVAEGFTSDRFDTFLLLGNPGAQDIQVEVEYLGDAGTLLTRTYDVPHTSRNTIWVNYEDPSLLDQALAFRATSVGGQSFLFERAMWWSAVPGGAWIESHASTDIGEASTQWSVAEAECGGASNAVTYLLLANRDARAGSVLVTMHYADGTTDAGTFPIGADSRLTLDLALEFPTTAGKRFAVSIDSVGANPVSLLVEKSLYWDVAGVWWAAGVSAPATPKVMPPI